MPRYVTACKLSTLAALLVITFLIFACGGDETQAQTPAPAPIDMSAITAQIQQTIRDELAMMPPPLSEAEIRSLIEDAVSKSVPKAISYAEIQAMVDSAVAAAYSGEEDGYGGEAVAETSTGRLEAIQQRGKVVCANNDSMAGFGFLDEAGNTIGFDVDLCRAVAAAVLGDANAVEFRPTVAFERGQSLQSGEIDMMSRNTTWTTSRDATWGNFAQTMFYDGQGFIVPKSLGVSSVYELEGASICVLRGTVTELNLLDFDIQNNMRFTIAPFEYNTGATEAYLQGQCDSLTTDQSDLVANAAGFSDPHAHVILPETLSEKPLGTVVPHGDEQWYDIVKSVMAMLIYAEAFGIHSGNVPSAVTGDTGIDRLSGLLGSYGQIFDRHLRPGDWYEKAAGTPSGTTRRAQTARRAARYTPRPSGSRRIRSQHGQLRICPTPGICRASVQVDNL